MYRVLVLVLALASASVAAAQSPGVTLHPLTGRPGIDGRAWMFVDLYTGAEPVVRPPGADYELQFTDRTSDTAGVTRSTVTLVRGGQPTRLTANAKTASVYVTPGGRYVFTEPLTVFDTKTDQRYFLDTQSFRIIAIAQDGRRLFLERADGEPFEVTLP